MSSTNLIVGEVLGAKTAKCTGLKDLSIKLSQYAAKARTLINQHGHNMETNPDYREAWERLVSLMSERKGRIGENSRLVDAIQAFLTSALA